MPVLEIIGWGGSSIIVWSMMQTRILRLRVLNLIGSLLQIVYNTALGVWPVVGLNVVLSVVQVVALTRLLRAQHREDGYELVEVEPDSGYLEHLMNRHRDDLAEFAPRFTAPRRDGQAFLLLKGEETVGYVTLHEEEPGIARIDLDYVTERYRDFTPGEFLFTHSDALTRAGYRRVRTPPDMKDPYYPRIGFEPVGDHYERELSAA